MRRLVAEPAGKQAGALEAHAVETSIRRRLPPEAHETAT
jgi:hypothetical protein